MTPAPEVGRRSGILLAAAALPLVVAGVWAAVRSLEAAAVIDGPGWSHAWLWGPVGGILLLQSVLYACERPHRAAASATASLRVAVLVPVYNEDPAYLRATLTALAAQTRRPDAVHLVDDGSAHDYADLRTWWTAHAREAGIRTTWQRTPNRGKRHAQALALLGYAQALRYLTVRRDDETTAHQVGTWLLTPVALLWAATVLRCVRWYAVLTCARTRWGTRADGPEVALPVPA
ncbi:glycosyltransferase family 2 protein [Streptomyces sp. NPDC049906]|uniref:glycosyltransferase family A protein n=1 Tax=Streptomyces sp. NPDC049906 TaxID=3155656 RepID=UPI00341F232B